MEALKKAIDAFVNAFKIGDLRKKLLFTLGVLIIYRVGAHITIPGVNAAVLAEYFKNKDYVAMPGVLCKNHGPFAWGKDPFEAVHNAVVLEEVAKMATRTEMINPEAKPAPKVLQDKHYYRKHGANAYYGQINKG